MTTELSALARLLVYPRHQTLNELSKIDHILQNSCHLDPHTKENLKTFTVALSAAPISALQNVYLASFEEDYKTLDLTQQNHESAEALRLLENLYHEHGLFRKRRSALLAGDSGISFYRVLQRSIVLD